MRKLKGPELRMPELKLPAFFANLYYDLRDRRLLPFIALVVVAIAAVPFLLGSKPESVQPPVEGAVAGVESTPERTTRLTVVEATPGLRDYRKRLGDRTPTNPFKQRYTSLPGAAQVESVESGSGGGGGGSSAVTVTEDGATGGAENAPSGGSGSNGAGGEAQAPRLIEFIIDVQISHEETSADGGQRMSEPEVRRRVPPLVQLPSKKTPVVTTGGVNLRNGKVVFLVSDDVESLDGDFNCMARTPTGICELLEVEPGFPLELVYGPDKVLYRIKVTKIDAVWAGRVGGSRSSRAAFNGLANVVLPAP
jgi:hypothetical protein